MQVHETGNYKFFENMTNSMLYYMEILSMIFQGFANIEK